MRACQTTQDKHCEVLLTVSVEMRVHKSVLQWKTAKTNCPVIVHLMRCNQIMNAKSRL